MILKVFLKGGSFLDVDLSKQVFIVSEEKLKILNECGELKTWEVSKLDEYILPLKILEGLRIIE